MISHKHKIIFIHIPKCAGSSIKDYYFDNPSVDWRKPNYELLYGWCPKRNLHLQHATTKELLETELISEENWKDYFKFTFVRNPYDRAYSDYLWIKKDRKIEDTFKNYIKKTGKFEKVLRDNTNKDYRGDHLLKQTDFFDMEGDFKIDFVGRFETLQQDIHKLNEILSYSAPFTQHSKKNKKRYNHYSLFYTASRKKLVQQIYANDLNKLNYNFEENKSGLIKLKNLI